MKANDAPNKTGQHMDITAPGKSMPPSSGKPIIVTNRPVLKQDPMIVIDGSIPEEPERESAPLNKLKINPIAQDAEGTVGDEGTDIKNTTSATTPVDSGPVTAVEELDASEVEDGITLEAEPDDKTKGTSSVKPIEVDSQADTETSTAELDDKPTGQDDTKKDLPKESSETKTDETEKEKDEDKETEKAEIDDENDDLSKQLAPNKSLDSAEQKAAEEEAKKKAEIDEIVESKKYFLPIDAVNQKKGNRRAIIILILVMVFAVIWLDMVLDAGILKLGSIHPVTHFFSS